MDELGKKFCEWHERDATHLNRQILLIGRFVMNERNWIDNFYKYPVGSVEFMLEAKKLWNELSVIFDETRELFSDMAQDKEDLHEVLDLMKKEFEKMNEQD